MAIIDLSRLPPPDIIEELDFEAVLALKNADYLRRLREDHPDAEAPLESDPAYKVLETSAYRETLLRARGNRLARAVLLASATGADLDQLAALYGVERLTITPADPTTTPPTPAVKESRRGSAPPHPVGARWLQCRGPQRRLHFPCSLSASANVLDVAFDSAPAPPSPTCTCCRVKPAATATRPRRCWMP